MGNEAQDFYDQKSDKVVEVMGKDWVSNAKHNIYDYKKSYKFDTFKDTLDRNKICIVVALGHSMVKWLPIIKSHRDSLYVICADTAYPILIEKEIIPDLVINIDPNLRIADSFKVKPRGKGSVLLTSLLSNPALTKGWRGRVCYFMATAPNGKIYRDLQATYPRVHCLENRCNVGEFAVSVATEHLKFKKVGYTGIDYCYKTEGIYPEGVTHIKNFTPTGSFEVTTLYDEEVRTDPIFMMYANVFNINYHVYHTLNTRCFNLSEGIIPLRRESSEFIKLLGDRDE